MISRRASPSTGPLSAACGRWNVAALAAQRLGVRFLGAAAVHSAGQARFDALTRTVRERSPFYRDAWRHLPAGRLQPAQLPVVGKRALMAAFDDWCTDREVTRGAVDEFLANREHIGERFLDRFLVWTSSCSPGDTGWRWQYAGYLVAAGSIAC